MIIAIKISIKFFLLLAVFIFFTSCGSMFEGKHDSVYLDIPENTRIYGEDSVEKDIKFDKKGSYIELDKKHDHNILFIHDSLVSRVEMESHISWAWVACDLLHIFNSSGTSIIHDYIMNGWGRFEDIHLSMNEFEKPAFDTDEFIEVTKNKTKKEVIHKNYIYATWADYDFVNVSINYERNLFQDLFLDNIYLNTSVGIYGIPIGEISGVPIRLSLSYGKRDQIELGGGIYLDYYPSNPKNYLQYDEIKPMFLIGYKHQDLNGGNVFRMGFIPTIRTKDEVFEFLDNLIVLYISFGVNF